MEYKVKQTYILHYKFYVMGRKEQMTLYQLLGVTEVSVFKIVPSQFSYLSPLA